jgi:hypothetical protein
MFNGKFEPGTYDGLKGFSHLLRPREPLGEISLKVPVQLDWLLFLIWDGEPSRQYYYTVKFLDPDGRVVVSKPKSGAQGWQKIPVYSLVKTIQISEFGFRRSGEDLTEFHVVQMVGIGPALVLPPVEQFRKWLDEADKIVANEGPEHPQEVLAAWLEGNWARLATAAVPAIRDISAIERENDRLQKDIVQHRIQNEEQKKILAETRSEVERARKELSLVPLSLEGMAKLVAEQRSDHEWWAKKYGVALLVVSALLVAFPTVAYTLLKSTPIWDKLILVTPTITVAAIILAMLYKLYAKHRAESGRLAESHKATMMFHVALDKISEDKKSELVLNTVSTLLQFRGSAFETQTEMKFPLQELVQAMAELSKIKSGISGS